MSSGIIKNDQLFMEQFYVDDKIDYWYLNPRGYLCDVIVETDAGKPWYLHDIRCEITDENKTALFGEFTLMAGSGYHCGGIRFPEPLPNTDTRKPYMLCFLDEHPRMKISVVHAMFS